MISTAPCRTGVIQDFSKFEKLYHEAYTEAKTMTAFIATLIP